MQTRTLADLQVGAIGLGTMGMSAFYTGAGTDDDESVRTIYRAIDQGVTLFDTAEAYGPYTNEELLARALGDRRDDVVIATKFGLLRHEEGESTPSTERHITSSPGSVRTALEGSLRRLGTDHIDLYYQHRVDPDVPIEDVIGQLAGFVEEGKIRHIGLSEVSVDETKAAREVAEIASVQNLYNLSDRSADELLGYAEAEGIGFIPWFPLATGKLAEAGGPLDELAAQHEASPSQLALAWLLHRSPVMLPIPGTSSVAHLDDNVAAARIELGDDEIVALTEAVK